MAHGGQQTHAALINTEAYSCVQASVLHDLTAAGFLKAWCAF